MTHPADYDVPRIFDEDRLWEYLDEHLNANGEPPQVAGIDAHGTPFLAWLDEEGGDCVGLRLVRLLPDDGGTTSAPTATEAPAQGCATALVYPVQIVAATRVTPPGSGVQR